MSRVPSDFKVTNVKRAIAAARAAGESVDRVDIAKDGCFDAMGRATR
jgi:hypothetical protein